MAEIPVGLNGIQTTLERSTPSLASGDTWRLETGEPSGKRGPRGAPGPLLQPAVLVAKQCTCSARTRRRAARRSDKQGERACPEYHFKRPSAHWVYGDKQRFRAVQHVERVGWHQAWILRQRMVQRTKLQTEPVQVLRKRASMRAFR